MGRENGRKSDFLRHVAIRVCRKVTLYMRCACVVVPPWAHESAVAQTTANLLQEAVDSRLQSPGELPAL